MTVASLGIATPAWRAARAAATVGALLHAAVAGDEALEALTAVGTPTGGWLDVIEEARRSKSIQLVLPRPGDVRRVALPRGVIAEGAVGWSRGRGASWLVATGTVSWDRVDLPEASLPLHDPVEAMRALRASVVREAHAIDLSDAADAVARTGSRAEQERIVDSWVLGPPPLPLDRREVAVLGLRMLMAVAGTRSLVRPDELEATGRTAVEAAFSAALPRR
jgi:hypothetical protein